jgi:hypothetical protein
MKHDIKTSDMTYAWEEMNNFPPTPTQPIDREEYERDLRRRQNEHLNGSYISWQPCLHDGCLECVGTGRKKNGEMCIHFISCPCPKCTPQCC